MNQANRTVPVRASSHRYLLTDANCLQLSCGKSTVLAFQNEQIYIGV